MALNLKDGILPISYVKSNAAKMMGIIKIAEKDIDGGRVRKADDVFKDLRERIVRGGKMTLSMPLFRLPRYTHTA